MGDGTGVGEYGIGEDRLEWLVRLDRLYQLDWLEPEMHPAEEALHSMMDRRGTVNKNKHKLKTKKFEFADARAAARAKRVQERAKK